MEDGKGRCKSFDTGKGKSLNGGRRRCVLPEEQVLRKDVTQKLLWQAPVGQEQGRRVRLEHREIEGLQARKRFRHLPSLSRRVLGVGQQESEFTPVHEHRRGADDGGVIGVGEFYIDMVIASKLEGGEQRLGEGRCYGPRRRPRARGGLAGG